MLVADDRISHRSFIGPHAAGKPIVQFLSHRFKYFNEAIWTSKVMEREVLLNGQPTDPQAPLKEGDEVCYLAMRIPEPSVPTEIPIVFEDEDLVVVNKPPHIPVHPTGRYLRNTLIHVLKKQKKLETLFLAHRLDRETSGLLVLTKSNLAKEKMYWQFFKNEVEKVYWALVWGRPSPPSGMIDAPMGSDEEGQKIRIKQIIGGPGAKTAKTKYHTLGTKWVHAPEWKPPEWPALTQALGSQKTPQEGTWPVSLVEARPITGRTNQIRVHLAHIGAGILGDKLYDPSEETFLAFKSRAPKLDDWSRKTPAKAARSNNFLNLSEDLMRRLILDAHALHARHIRFRHPRSGKFVELEAAPPKSWQGLYESRARSR